MHRLSRYLEIATVLFIALNIGYQIFCPPIIGIADTGDFARVLNHFGVTQAAPAYSDRYFDYVNRLFIVDPGVHWTPFSLFSGFVSSENGLFAIALWASHLLSKFPGYFDIRYLGATHALLFLAAIYVALRALSGRPFPIRIAACLAAIFIFGDGAYIEFFNTPSAEAALLCFYLLMLASMLRMVERGIIDSWRFPVLFLLSGLGLATTKNAYFVFGWLLVLAAIRLRSLDADLIRRRSVMVMAALIALISTVYLNRVPVDMRQSYNYNMLFWQILPSSTDPGADLKALGLDPELKARSGTYAYQDGVDIASPDLQKKLYDRIGPSTVIRYYSLHPTRALSLIGVGLDAAWSIAPLHLGNFEKSSGLPPRAQSTVWRLWSHAKLSFASAGWFWTLILFVPTLVVNRLVRARTSNPDSRLYCDLQVALMAIAILEVFFAVFSQGTLDIDRKMFVFNLLTDTVIAMNICFAVDYFSSLYRPVPAHSSC